MIRALLSAIPGAPQYPGKRGAGGSLPALADDILARPVLVIEDESLIAWMVESLLQDLGFSRITLAASAAEALRSARRTPPGLIVSDINLGSGLPDGVDAVSALEPDAGVPVVFVTAHADAANRARIGSGFPLHAIIAKPVALEVLGTALHRLFAPRNAH